MNLFLFGGECFGVDSHVGDFAVDAVRTGGNCRTVFLLQDRNLAIGGRCVSAERVVVQGVASMGRFSDRGENGFSAAF